MPYALLLAPLLALQSDVPVPVSVMDGRTGERVEDAEVRVISLAPTGFAPPWGDEDPVAYARTFGAEVTIADNKLVLPGVLAPTPNLLIAIADDRVDYRVQRFGTKIESLSFEVHSRRSLRVRARDPDGQEVVGMPLLFRYSDFDFGCDRTLGWTGDDGTFLLTDLDWYLATRTDDEERRSLGIKADYAFASLDAESGGYVRIARSTVQGRAPELVLQCQPTGTVNVKIARFDQGSRIPMVAISLLSEHNDRWRRFFQLLGSDGCVRFRVEVGSKFRIQWRRPRGRPSEWDGDSTEVRDGPGKAGETVEVLLTRDA